MPSVNVDEERTRILGRPQIRSIDQSLGVLKDWNNIARNNKKNENIPRELFKWKILVAINGLGRCTGRGKIATQFVTTVMAAVVLGRATTKDAKRPRTWRRAEKRSIAAILHVSTREFRGFRAIACVFRAFWYLRDRHVGCRGPSRWATDPLGPRRCSRDHCRRPCDASPGTNIPAAPNSTPFSTVMQRIVRCTLTAARCTRGRSGSPGHLNFSPLFLPSSSRFARHGTSMIPDSSKWFEMNFHYSPWWSGDEHGVSIPDLQNNLFIKLICQTSKFFIENEYNFSSDIIYNIIWYNTM